jgi:hypothetical protein
MFGFIATGTKCSDAQRCILSSGEFIPPGADPGPLGGANLRRGAQSYRPLAIYQATLIDHR